jgi:hypothetical protein
MTMNHNDTEIAAAIAAVLHMLEGEQPPATESAAEPWAWRGTRTLMTQGMVPARPATRPRWNTIERLRRVGRGGSGVTGM